MKKILILSVSSLLLTAFCFSCNKENATASFTELSQGPSGEESSCGDVIQGEPTYIQGYYTYPTQTLNFNNGMHAELSYDALTVRNRFEIYDANGSYVTGTNGYVTGTGKIEFCVLNGPYSLIVKAYSPAKSLDRWTVKIACYDACL